MKQRALIPAAILLAALTMLVRVLVGSALPGRPVCGAASALAVLPLGVDWPEGRLAAYGRSVAVMRPGDTLCLALAWETNIGAGDTAPIIRIELVGPEGQIAARYQGPAAKDWGPNTARTGLIGLRSDRRAVEGSYLIDLALLDAAGNPAWTLNGKTVISIGIVAIDANAPPQAGLIDADDVRGLKFRGRLSEWPFWPQPVDADEET